MFKIISKLSERKKAILNAVRYLSKHGALKTEYCFNTIGNEGKPTLRIIYWKRLDFCSNPYVYINSSFQSFTNKQLENLKYKETML